MKTKIMCFERGVGILGAGRRRVSEGGGSVVSLFKKETADEVGEDGCWWV